LQYLSRYLKRPLFLLKNIFYADLFQMRRTGQPVLHDNTKFFLQENITRLSSPRFFLSKDVIELIGVVEECYPNTTFRVRITSDEAKDHQLLCHLAGRMRVNKVRILPGDRVKVEMTPYDLQKGRIVYRFRSDDPRSLGGPATPPSTPSSAPAA
jgi:translation initiation factor IF-1